MRKLKRLYISIFTLILSIGMFGTVSYAWISLATINNIDGLTITASSGNELEISLDGITFSNELPTVELMELFEGIILVDVTSMDGINFYTGGMRDEGNAVPGFHYLSFDLWFRTEKDEHGIYLVNNVNDMVTFDTNYPGTYVVSRGVQWTTKHNFYNGPTLSDMVFAGTTDTYYASNALRISVLEMHNEHNHLDQRPADKLRTFIYDPSEDETRGFGEIFGAFNYFLRSANILLDLPVEKPETSYRLSEIDPYNPYQALDNTSMVAMMQPTEQQDAFGETYYMAKVRINIWVEGWDADTFDAIHKDMVKIQLQFKALNPAVTP